MGKCDFLFLIKVRRLDIFLTTTFASRRNAKVRGKRACFLSSKDHSSFNFFFLLTPKVSGASSRAHSSILATLIFTWIESYLSGGISISSTDCYYYENACIASRAVSREEVEMLLPRRIKNSNQPHAKLANCIRASIEILSQGTHRQYKSPRLAYTEHISR